MLKICVLAAILALVGPAWSQTVSLEVDRGSAQLETDLSLNGPFPSAGEDDSPYAWSIDASMQRTVSSNEGADPIVDNSTNLSGGLSFDGVSDWNLGTKFNYSQTPEENLVSRGTQLSGGYEWKYGPKIEPSDFQPFFEVTLQGAHSNYIESYSADIPRKKGTPVHTAGTSEIRQGSLGLLIDWKPSELWRYNLEVDQYSYNRDVVAFQNQLDSSSALKQGKGGFSNTVGGLASSGFTLGFVWKYTELWKLGVSEQIAKLAVDGSVGQTFKTIFEGQLSKVWKLTVGYEREQSNTFSDTLAILGVQYERE